MHLDSLLVLDALSNRPSATAGKSLARTRVRRSAACPERMAEGPGTLPCCAGGVTATVVGSLHFLGC